MRPKFKYAAELVDYIQKNITIDMIRKQGVFLDPIYVTSAVVKEFMTSEYQGSLLINNRQVYLIFEHIGAGVYWLKFS